MGIDDFVPDPEWKISGYPTDEDAVVHLLEDHLSERYEAIYTSSDRVSQDIDLLAECDDHVLGVEAKADYPKHRQGKAYTALGQILYRMDFEDVTRDDRRGAIAFPRKIDGQEPFKDLLDTRFSAGILGRTSIWSILVDEDGYDMYAPGELGTANSQ